MHNIGCKLMKLCNWTGAASYFKKARKIDPSFLPTQMCLGLVWEELRNGKGLKKAIGQYQMVVTQSSGTDPTTHAKAVRALARAEKKLAAFNKVGPTAKAKHSKKEAGHAHASPDAERGQQSLSQTECGGCRNLQR